MFVLNVSIIVSLFVISLVCSAIWIHVMISIHLVDLNLYLVVGCLVLIDLFN